MVEVADERPMLNYLSMDSRSNLLVLRWLAFLLERVPQKELPQLFDYYRRIGWIGKDVRDKLAQISEGVKPDQEGLPPSGELEEYELALELAEHSLLLERGQGKGMKKPSGRPPRRQVLGEGQEPRAQAASGWQLTVDDHLRSWMFITELTGEVVDRNLWEEVDRHARRIHEDLRRYYEV